MKLFLRTAFVIGMVALVRKLLDNDAGPSSTASRPRRPRASQDGGAMGRLADSLSGSTAISDGEVAVESAGAEAGGAAIIAAAAPSLRKKRPLPAVGD